MDHQIVHYAVVQAVTPHDTNPNQFKGFYVNVAGNVVFKDSQGNTATIAALAGVVYNLSTTVITTASTATGIHGLT